MTAPTMESSAELTVSDLSVDVGTDDDQVHIVDGVTFTARPGRTTGIIGESGSGKTMTIRALVGLLPDQAVTRGHIGWQGRELVGATEKQWRAVRGTDISMVFQDSLAALNPTQTVGRQVTEILRLHGASRTEARRRGIELLGRVGINEPERRFSEYPHQFSGGMRQRAVIALALAGGPKVLLADEPTTALDVTIQAKILDLLRSLREKEGLALILVSHDLRVMAHVADDLHVMYAGRVVESGPASELLSAPRHPYTKALVNSVPAVNSRSALAHPISGSPVGPRNRPTGCAFHPRCPMAQDLCAEADPDLRPSGSERLSACHFFEELEQ